MLCLVVGPEGGGGGVGGVVQAVLDLNTCFCLKCGYLCCFNRLGNVQGELGLVCENPLQLGLVNV